jgi:hypothetical protein
MSEFVYIADSSALITLISPKRALAKPRDLTKLAKGGRIKIADPVAREIRRRDDKLKGWIDRHLKECELKATNENTVDLGRISRDHVYYLGDKPGAADPVVVCLAKYYEDKEWVVLSDDAGVQAACLIENIRYVTSAAFCRLESL